MDKLQRLEEAGIALYYAGHWNTGFSSDNLTEEEQAKLWENLRDALGLPPGTSKQYG